MSLHLDVQDACYYSKNHISILTVHDEETTLKGARHTLDCWVTREIWPPRALQSTLTNSASDDAIGLPTGTGDGFEGPPMIEHG